MKKRIFLLSVAFCISFCMGLLCDFARAQSPQEEPEKFPFVAEITSKGVNLRAGQSANFEKLGRLDAGTDIVVMDRSYSWYKIKLPTNAKSYISSKYVSMLGDGVGEVSGNRVNIRAFNGVNSTAIGQVNKGYLVRVLENKGEWYRIEPIEESYGWVLVDYVKYKTRALPPPRVVERPTRNIYVKKRLAEQKDEKKVEAVVDPEAKYRVSRRGIVQDLGVETISSEIRHKLVLEDQSVYYLKGYRHIIDGFLRNEVKIEGKIQSGIKAKHPVLLVTKIHLVM